MTARCRFAGCLALAGVTSCGVTAGAGSVPEQRASYAIRGARILDVGSGLYSAPSVILVTGDKLVRVLQAESYRTDLADSTVNLAGKVVLPGLIDAHVHLVLGGPVRANALADLRAGFTTVVDLGALAHRLLRIRDSINAGIIPGPRVLAAGMWVGVKGGVCEFTGIGVVGGPEQFRARVRENIAAGADVIKLCVSGWANEAFANPAQYEMPDDALVASVQEAHQHRRLVVAHDLSRGGVRAALRANVDGLAHAAYLDSATALEMRAKNVFMIPTLASLATGDTSDATRALVASVALAHRLGVRLVFGTDGGVLRHGNNADEFTALVRAGIPPLAAVRAATINAATAFGLADSLGAVRAGMLADLIAVDGDPLQDVATLRAPHFVMSRGKIVPR